MSLLNVNKIDPATGTALEIGTSGDTITVPSGATFNVAGTLQSGGAALGNNTPNFGAKATSNQTGLSSGGWTKVQFDTEYFDVGGGYDATNDKFVVPAGEGGKYYFTASAKINPRTTAGLIGSGMRLTVNGSAPNGLEEIHFMNNNPSNSEGKNVNGILDLSAADEIEVYAYYQDSSAAAGTITGVTSEVDTFFFGYKLAE
jgi:hypothetical protein